LHARTSLTTPLRSHPFAAFLPFHNNFRVFRGQTFLPRSVPQCLSASVVSLRFIPSVSIGFHRCDQNPLHRRSAAVEGRSLQRDTLLAVASNLSMEIGGFSH